jgi:hypothetical protein
MSKKIHLKDFSERKQRKTNENERALPNWAITVSVYWLLAAWTCQNNNNPNLSLHHLTEET